MEGVRYSAFGQVIYFYSASTNNFPFGASLEFTPDCEAVSNFIWTAMLHPDYNPDRVKKDK